MNTIAASLSTVRFSWSRKKLLSAVRWGERYALLIIFIALSIVSISSYVYYSHNGLALAYNDARSHLDIGRRVVEGLKPGIAQLGSVWLPLPHLLMIPLVWQDDLWHSGFAGSFWSMLSFVGTGALIYMFLMRLGVGMLGRVAGELFFAANINVLYLQSTAMTELLLLFTMTAGAYYILLWFKDQRTVHLIHAALWIMLSSLVRYDGWFLLAFSAGLVALYIWRRKSYRYAEGVTILFITLASFGVFLWLLWNLLIFKDPLYFIFGPYSAHMQQEQLEAAGVLATKWNFPFSVRVYLHALAYNSGAFALLVAAAGAVFLWRDRRVPSGVRLATVVLVAPLLFNVLALYMGHSVLFVQGLSGDTWFNVRYGIMLMPSLAIFIGYLIHRARGLRPVLISLLLFTTFFAFHSSDAVTIDDARVGSSQKNVSEVSSWLHAHAADTPGFVLISAASHDAIIFSSGLPMKKFIHEGTGKYWEHALEMPDRWARWIVMRTYSDEDSVWRGVSRTPAFENYERVAAYPFADIYQLRAEYLDALTLEPVLGKQK